MKNVSERRGGLARISWMHWRRHEVKFTKCSCSCERRDLILSLQFILIGG